MFLDKIFNAIERGENIPNEIFEEYVRDVKAYVEIRNKTKELHNKLCGNN